MEGNEKNWAFGSFFNNFIVYRTHAFISDFKKKNNYTDKRSKLICVSNSVYLFQFCEGDKQNAKKNTPGIDEIINLVLKKKLLIIEHLT